MNCICKHNITASLWSEVGFWKKRRISVSSNNKHLDNAQKHLKYIAIQIRRKQCLCKILGVNKVHYGLGENCELDVVVVIALASHHWGLG